MKQEQQVLQEKIDLADKVIKQELNSFKQSIIRQFHEISTEFTNFERNASIKQSEQWAAYMQKMQEYNL